jgi:hypothetical protein
LYLAVKLIVGTSFAARKHTLATKKRRDISIILSENSKKILTCTGYQIGRLPSDVINSLTPAQIATVQGDVIGSMTITLFRFKVNLIADLCEQFLSRLLCCAATAFVHAASPVKAIFASVKKDIKIHSIQIYRSRH